MKKILLKFFLFATVLFLFGKKINAQTNNSLLRHIVIITFKQDAPADSIKALDNIYTDLSKSPLVKDFEMGVNISPRDTGVIKHVFMTTFSSKEDMDTYKKSALYKTLFNQIEKLVEEHGSHQRWVFPSTAPEGIEERIPGLYTIIATACKKGSLHG